MLYPYEDMFADDLLVHFDVATGSAEVHVQ